MASKGKATTKASSTRVHGSTSQQQSLLEIQLYETPTHEERDKILEERRALHERTIKFPKGKDTFEERILARGWGFMYELSILINLSWVREFYANKTDGRPVAALATGLEFLNFQNIDSIIVEESKPIVRLTAGFRQQERCHRACNQLKIPSIKLVSFSIGIEILWLNGCENIGVAMVE
ncbi:hypothetical protein PIB30_074715 [Stylosanthes scabra]|uniref:Uncharacterized protein n=1 Tax=Stylosanthes scabra TaxID=79078 RepID=A0ABU6RPL1_9FABA|nr:hypothetical protein [Stylosanthes scabra]